MSTLILCSPYLCYGNPAPVCYAVPPVLCLPNSPSAPACAALCSDVWSCLLTCAPLLYPCAVPLQVADCYGPDATLLPTVSNEVRTTRAGIVDYFNAFLQKKPQGVINESHVQIYSADLAAHYGIYTFTLTNPDGSTQQVGARFSFTYKKAGSQWLIAEHHSSGLPERVLPAESMICGLFDKWNAALATLDPVQVRVCGAAVRSEQACMYGCKRVMGALWMLLTYF
jgi:uncharacterized protein (TIGR02246 family)